jgi:hypothetical protein
MTASDSIVCCPHRGHNDQVAAEVPQIGHFALQFWTAHFAHVQKGAQTACVSTA